MVNILHQVFFLTLSFSPMKGMAKCYIKLTYLHAVKDLPDLTTIYLIRICEDRTRECRFPLLPGDSAASPVWELLDYMTSKLSSSSNILCLKENIHPQMQNT